jgi:hypothetical protein
MGLYVNSQWAASHFPGFGGVASGQLARHTAVSGHLTPVLYQHNGKRICAAAAAALQVGYPLVTVLVCLVDAENYTRQVESMADFLVKQMKVKEYR